MDVMNIGAVILAAGHGTRMKSEVSKVLHPLAGRPLVHFPIAAALGIGTTQLVLVVGPHNVDALDVYVRAAYPGVHVATAVQSPARGTGDAARIGLGALPAAADWVLILCGDTPLIQSEDLAALASAAATEPGPDLWVMTCVVDQPHGYGRIIKDADGCVTEIREQRDLRGPEQEAIAEINSGVYLVRRTLLERGLSGLQPNNAQGEYYLTDIVAVAVAAGGARSVTSSPLASLGVNDRAQLHDLELKWYARRNDELRRSGVTVRDGVQVDVDAQVAPDALLDVNVQLRGGTQVGAGASVGAGCVLTDTAVGAGARIGAYSVLTGDLVGAGQQLEPLSVVDRTPT